MAAIRTLYQRFQDIPRRLPMQDFVDYDDYWEQRGGISKVLERWKVAAETIPDGATVLDVGSGQGEFLTYLQAVRPNARITGADFSPAAVSKIEERGFPGMLLDLGKKDIVGVYDYITCFEVLEHIPNAEDAIMRLSAACRKLMIVSIPNVAYVVNRIRLLLFGRFPLTNCQLHIKEHVRHWGKRDFEDWTRHFDLRIIRTEGQYGPRGTPWRRVPGLFASGLIYVLEVEGER